MEMSAAGCVRSSSATSAAAVVVRLGHQPAAGDAALRSSSALRISASFFCAHALELAQMRPSRAARSSSSSVRMLELAVEQRDRLRADSLQVEQIEDRRRELLQQVLVIRHRAGLDELADLRGEVLADAGSRAAARRRQVASRSRLVRRSFRRRCGTRES